MISSASSRLASSSWGSTIGVGFAVDINAATTTSGPPAPLTRPEIR